MGRRGASGVRLERCPQLLVVQRTVPCAWLPTGGAQRLQEGSSGGLKDRRRGIGFVVTLVLLGFEQFGVLLLFAALCVEGQQVREQQ